LDWAPTIVLPDHDHCWLSAVPHVHTITGVPFVVPRPEASRHSVPFERH
jgi:hypothetical protein